MINVPFPKITARNLEGLPVEVPADLTGSANLVVLAFLREHQYPVETWLPHLAALEANFPKFVVWEIPALARRYRLWRGAIESAMRAGIADPLVRSHTLPSYLDLEALQSSLGLRSLDDIHLYLLDREGWVRWEGSGAYDAETLGSLDAALAGLLGGS